MTLCWGCNVASRVAWWEHTVFETWIGRQRILAGGQCIFSLPLWGVAVESRFSANVAACVVCIHVASRACSDTDEIARWWPLTTGTRHNRRRCRTNLWSWLPRRTSNVLVMTYSSVWLISYLCLKQISLECLQFLLLCWLATSILRSWLIWTCCHTSLFGLNKTHWVVLLGWCGRFKLQMLHIRWW